MKVSELKAGQKFIDPKSKPSYGVGGLCADGPYDVFTMISGKVENGQVQARNEEKGEIVSFDADYQATHAYWIEPLPAEIDTAKGAQKIRRRS